MSSIHTADTVDPLFQMHERCGILTACLIDPLSQLINRIMGAREDDINAVGFYYETEPGRCTVILFNTYDNDPIPWIRLGITMKLFMASPFVTKIVFYPLDGTASGSLFNRKSIGFKPVPHRLEDIFRTLIIETSSNNSRVSHDKNLSYTLMLLRAAKITGDDIHRLNRSVITGYGLVNRLLSQLMGAKNPDVTKLSTSLMPCPLLKKSVSLIAKPDNSNTNDIEYVVEESRREITKLVAVFIDLFTSNSRFRSIILGMRESRTSNFSLDSLFNRENELISLIVGGLQTGIISNQNMNEIIHDLSKERFNLGNYQPLPLSINPSKTINIINEVIPCTFQQTITVHNTEPLRDLGVYINHIADSFDNPETLIINLGGLISSYNASIEGTNLQKIEIPHVGGNNTLSRQAIITIPGNSNNGNVEVPINSTVIPIAMYNSNLTILTEAQLLDVLVYIDSLRNTDGNGDTRFINLQNEITHEIASRRKAGSSK